MHDYLDQVEWAANTNRLFYLSLAAALNIPDMCSALGAKDGQTTGALYIAWYDEHMAPRYAHQGRPSTFPGADCYRFRCSFLHQGTTQHPKATFGRILFTEPPMTMHMCTFNVDEAIAFDVKLFCLDMVDAARRWIASVEGTEPYETNARSFIQRYSGGFIPFVVGFPVIT